MTPSPKFTPVETTANRLGLPVAWLKSEAEAGRVPVLRAGRRLLMDVEEVRSALLKRSAATEAAACSS